jgi:hypothetical protein
MQGILGDTNSYSFTGKNCLTRTGSPDSCSRPFFSAVNPNMGKYSINNIFEQRLSAKDGKLG